MPRRADRSHAEGQFAVVERGLTGEGGYREEPGVGKDSKTPTYVALKLFIDTWRWQGVPFYVRAGKGMGKRVTEVSIHFKSVPHCLFNTSDT